MPSKPTSAPAPDLSPAPPSGNGNGNGNTTLRQRRPSLTSTLLTTAQTLETKLEDTLTRLIPWDDLPAWRRDNPSILHGYRRTSGSLLGSLRSLLYLHNESVNVYTHLVGAAGFLALGLYLRGLIAPRYGSASAADVLALGCFFAGAVGCLGMSATYHLLCNHSEAVARWGNKLDYSGIVLLIVGSYVPALWYGFFCWAGWLTGYLGAVSTPSFSPSRSLFLERRCADRGMVAVDCAAGAGMLGGVMVRAFPHARVEAVSSADVCWTGAVGRRADPACPHLLRVSGAG